LIFLDLIFTFLRIDFPFVRSLFRFKPGAMTAVMMTAFVACLLRFWRDAASDFGVPVAALQPENEDSLK